MKTELKKDVFLKIKDNSAKEIGFKAGFHQFEDDVRPCELTLKLIDEVIKQTLEIKNEEFNK